MFPSVSDLNMLAESDGSSHLDFQEHSKGKLQYLCYFNTNMWLLLISFPPQLSMSSQYFPINLCLLQSLDTFPSTIQPYIYCGLFPFAVWLQTIRLFSKARPHCPAFISNLKLCLHDFDRPFHNDAGVTPFRWQTSEVSRCWPQAAGGWAAKGIPAAGSQLHLFLRPAPHHLSNLQSRSAGITVR